MVSGVHLGDDHVGEHSSQNVSDCHQREVLTPVLIHLGEVSPAGCSFNESSDAGVETGTSLVLTQQNGEVVAEKKKQEESEEQPLSEIESSQLDELSEGAEEASGLQREEESEGDNDSEEAQIEGEEVGLALDEVQEAESIAIGELEIELVGLESLAEEENEGHLQKNHRDFQDNDISAESASELVPALSKIDALEEKGEGEEEEEEALEK